MRRLRHCFTCALTGAVILTPGPALAQLKPLTHYDAVSTPESIETTGQSQNVALRPDGFDRMTVQVHLEGSGPYNFLVDTGADHTVISSSLVASLRLAGADRVQIYTISGDQSVNTAAVNTMQFSKKTLRNVNAVILERANLGADGILGIDSLRSERVTFDFSKGVMTIVPSAVAEPRIDKDTIVVTGKLRSGRLVLTEARAGGHAVSVVVDTGSDVTVGNAALQRKLGGSRLLRPIGPISLQSVTGQIITGELMTLNMLDVGDVAMKNLNIVFAEAPIFKALKLDEKPAVILGMNAIRAFERVSIDFANRKFRVVLPQKSSIESVRLASR
jgi:predicted aspartyl protease